MKTCEFLKEHLHLINLLNTSKDKQFKKEANKQLKEVMEYLKKLKRN